MEAKSIIERDDNRRERDKCSYLLHYGNGKLSRGQKRRRGIIMLAKW